MGERLKMEFVFQLELDHMDKEGDFFFFPNDSTLPAEVKLSFSTLEMKPWSHTVLRGVFASPPHPTDNASKRVVSTPFSPWMLRGFFLRTLHLLHTVCLKAAVRETILLNAPDPSRPPNAIYKKGKYEA